MGFTGRSNVNCIYYDIDYGKCKCKDKKQWYELFLPECPLAKNIKEKCQYQTYNDAK